MKVVILAFEGYGPWDDEVQTAEQVGAEVEIVDYDQLRQRPPHCDVLINSWGYPIPGDLLSQMAGCSLLIGYGTGTDYVDVDLAARLGIQVANTPGLNVEDVATHTLALLLACVRKIVDYDTALRSGPFHSAAGHDCRRLQGKTLGVLAFGRIPRRLRELVRPFAMRVLACDPYVPAQDMRALDVESVELEELLHAAEILSVHTPATAKTRGLLTEERLRLLPRGAIVLITGRGSVYDPDALARLLHEGHLMAAGLDVFPQEPLPHDHPLMSAPRAILTPHCAGDSMEAIAAYHRAGAEALRAYAEGRPVPNVVNGRL